jgi:hypothetical protein
MPHYHQLSFTGLELKALWVLATGGTTTGDALLDQAGAAAVDKLYRAERGMPRKGYAPIAPVRGPDLDVRRPA